MLDSIYQIMKSGTVFGQFMQVIPITCVVGILYAVWRVIRVKKKKLHIQWGAEIMRWLFVCYLTGLINLVLVPSNMWSHFFFFLKNGYPAGDLDPLFSGGFNLTPTLLKCLMGEYTIGRWVRDMLTGNLLMFIPMGFFLPLVSERVGRHNILKIAVAVPVVVEVIQIIIGRSFDVDDLILNFAGIVAGYFIAVGIKKYYSIIKEQRCSEADKRPCSESK